MTILSKYLKRLVRGFLLLQLSQMRKVDKMVLLWDIPVNTDKNNSEIEDKVIKGDRSWYLFTIKRFKEKMLKLIINSVHFTDAETVKILQSPLPFNTVTPLVDLTTTLPGLFPPLSPLCRLPAEPPMLLPVLNLALLVAVEGLEKVGDI